MLLYAAKSNLMHHYSNIKKINTKIKRKKLESDVERNMLHVVQQ